MPLRERLDLWIDDERPDWKNADTNPALLLNPGVRLTTRGARNITTIADDANLTQEFSSHVLRHTFGTTMIREKHDIVVAEIMGHQRLETTRSYTLAYRQRPRTRRQQHPPATADQAN